MSEQCQNLRVTDKIWPMEDQDNTGSKSLLDLQAFMVAYEATNSNNASCAWYFIPKCFFLLKSKEVDADMLGCIQILVICSDPASA